MLPLCRTLSVPTSKAALMALMTSSVLHAAQPMPPTLIQRNTRNLMGREQQVAAVLGSLHRHGAAVIWGSPGEGKTALAAEAGCCLQEGATANIYLSVRLDMKGAEACGPSH